MQITELPNIINPNTLLKQRIKEKYGSKCPCCGETKSFWQRCEKKEAIKGIAQTLYFSWYGKQYEYSPGKNTANWLFFPPVKYWFEKKRHWKIDIYHCFTCGTQWETSAYPTEILTLKETEDIYNKIFSGR